MCVCVDGRALAVGGMGADLLPRSILQQYDLRKDVWALLPPMPTPRYDANTHLLGNKLYVAGTNQPVSLCLYYYRIFTLCIKEQNFFFFCGFSTHFTSI